MLLISLFSFAQTNTWDGSSDANWNTAANWSLNVVPTAAHDVVIPNGITATITVNTVAVCKTFTMNGGDKTNTVTISGANSLTVLGAVVINASASNNVNKTLAVGSGTLNAASLIMVNRNGDSRDCILSLSTGTVNISGNITMNGNAARNQIVFTGAGTVNVGGNMSGGGLTASTGTVNYVGNGAQSIGGYNYYNLSTSGSGDKTMAAAVAVNNNLIVGTGTWLIDNDRQITGNATGTLTVQNDGVLQLGGKDDKLKVNATSFPTLYTKAKIDLQTGSEVRYNYNGENGGTQTISTVPTYYFLHCQYPGTKMPTSGVLIINGNFDTASPLDLSTTDPTINLKGDFNLLTVPAKVSLTGNLFSIGGNFNNALLSGGSLVSGNGTINFNGPGAQSITGGSPVATPFFNLIINKPSGTLSLTNSNQPVANNLTITAGTLDLSTYTLNRTASGGTLIVSNGAALRIGGANNYPTNFTTNTIGATSTVEYYANANQTVSPRNYGNLIFSGSGIKSTSNTTSVASNLYISNGVKANVAAGTNINSGSLTLGVYKKINGTWGSTTSAAIYKDNGYFQPTTGIVTVTNDTRPTAEFLDLTTSQSICFGTPTTTLSGTVSNGGSLFLAAGETISVTINGTTQTTAIVGNTGGFAINFNTASLPISNGYTINYNFAGNGSFKSATNSTTELKVNSKPVIDEIYYLAPFCSGGALNPAAPNINENGSPVTAAGWQLETAVGSGIFVDIATSYTVPYADNNKKLRYYATNSCGISYNKGIALTVNQPLTITLATNPKVTQLSTSTLLPYTANNGTGYFIVFDAAAKSAGFADANGDISGLSGNLSINVPDCVAAGVYNAKIRVITYSPACSSVEFPFTITVTAAPATTTSVSLGADQTICAGSLPVNLVATGIGINGKEIIKWQKAYDAAFTASTDIESTATILTGTAIGMLTQNTYFRAVYESNGCAKLVTNTIVIKVGPAAIIPVIQINAATCSAPGSAKMTNYANGTTYTFTPAGPSVGNSGNITGFTTGTSYTVTANNGSCLSARSAPFTVAAQLPTPTISLTSAVGTNNQSVCYNTGIIPIQYNIQNVTGVTVNRLPTGVTYNLSSGVLTISGTPSESSNFTITATNGSCSSAIAMGSITVEPLPFASVAVSGNTQVCKNTSAVFVLTGTPGSVVTYNYNGIESLNVTISVGGTAQLLVPGLTATKTLNIVSVSNGTCTNLTKSSATVTVGATSTFTVTGWDKGIPNDNGLSAVIAANYSTKEQGSFSACNCMVNEGSVLTIAQDTYVVVRDEIINNGRLIVESDGNLKQINKEKNSTPISVRRLFTLTDARNQYTYISAPVAGQNMKLIFGNYEPNIPYVTVLKESTNMFVNAAGADYQIPAKGFSVKEPKKKGYSNQSGDILADNEAQFSGIPNNGDISLELKHSNEDRGFNLVGNPYPSNLDIVDLYNASNKNENGTPDIRPEFKFWDNSINNFYIQQGGAYKGWSYAVFNVANDGGYGTAAPGKVADLNSPATSASLKVPTRVVKVGQAFMVRALKSGAEMKFTNDMRRISNDSTVFYGKESAHNRYRVEYITPESLLIQNAISYFAGGNGGFGNEDSVIPNTAASDAIFSIVENEKLIINGNALFNKDNVIRIGTSSSKFGIHQIRAVDREGVFAAGQNIYLKDKQTGILANLTEGAYSFTSEAGVFTNRFEIIYEPESVLGTSGNTKANIQLYRDQLDFVVQSAVKRIQNIELYDMSGRLIFTQKGSSKEIRFNAEQLVNGNYILKAQLENGEIFTKKLRK